MRFRRKRDRARGADHTPAEDHAWKDSGLADEVEAFLGGRFVDHLAKHGQPVPAWAVVNRLAHADHAELVRLVDGDLLDARYGAAKPHGWAVPERFIAANILVTRGATPERLREIQRVVLVPLELRLIEDTRHEKMTAEQVLDAVARSLESFPTGA
ncbi:MAG: hypothetical protein ACRDYV_13685 [Acidimicrobiia bacterium]